MASEISIIVPVYNRPAELEELLLSLSVQTESAFDVIIVEDGSQLRSDAVAKSYDDKLQIKYFYKENSGPGLSRNYGCEKSQSGFFVFFDSDCVVPPTYIADLKQHLQDLDAFGGPDRSHASFTPVQKAISYSMTSLFTTGGIRGNKKSVEKFHPRSFNMGFTREVFEKTGGFSSMRFGEDIDLSIRIVAQGFSSKLIPECFVFHKRRTDFRKFFKQVFNSGIARINLYKRHPQSLRLLHFFPSAFVIYQFLSIPHALYHQQLWVLYPTVAYLLLLLTDALKTEKNQQLLCFPFGRLWFSYLVTVWVLLKVLSKGSSLASPNSTPTIRRFISEGSSAHRQGSYDHGLVTTTLPTLLTAVVS